MVDYLGNEVRVQVQGHSDPKIAWVTLQPKDAPIHQILKIEPYRRYAPDTIFKK